MGKIQHLTRRYLQRLKTKVSLHDVISGPKPEDRSWRINRLKRQPFTPLCIRSSLN